MVVVVLFVGVLVFVSEVCFGLWLPKACTCDEETTLGQTKGCFLPLSCGVKHLY